MIHIWRLSEAGDSNLGLACTQDGLVLGRTALIERRAQGFFVRERSEIERLLCRAYRSEVAVARLMPGLATVAAALNANDPSLARIAAVHLKIPDLPHQTARDGMEAEDTLIKYARDEGGGADWNPALHPRAGTPPNPGWFAPTGGSGDESSPLQTAQHDDPTRRSDVSPNVGDDWVRLPPGHQRIDELADFVEWMANASPQDEQAIRAEIKRYFYDAGDPGGAAELNSVLTTLLKPGITRQDRQQLLNRLDVFTSADPAEYARNRDWATGAALLGAGVPPVAADEAGAAERAAEENTATEAAETEAAAAETPSQVWKYGWAKRGREIHDLLGDGSLHPNFPTIDMFSPSGVATSIKSIDLNAAVYEKDTSLAYRLNNYFDKVSEFDGAHFADYDIDPDQITGRVLQLVIPKGSLSEAQRIVIEAARMRAKALNRPVELIITQL